ncbi:hypothetical protein [Paraburkholderia sp. A3RO-2L]|uniref:hypothetical protein n=1 Tax=unclassified Paraburkholderia TaxID=2615204 RepID=UPI0032FD6D87|nr:hypothetical protein [Burkholderia vietnamiensis]
MMTESGAAVVEESASLQAKIEKITSLASSLAPLGDNVRDFPEGGAAHALNAQLAQLVTRHLESGSDDVLMSALMYLAPRDAGEGAAWHTLRDYIRTYAGWARLDETGAAASDEYFLCSIPVFLGPERPQVSMEKLMALEGVLRECGLVCAGAEVTLVPCGLVPAELVSSWTYSQVKQLTQVLVQSKRGNAWHLAAEFLATSYARLDRSLGATDLYSMLVLYRTQDRVLPFTYGRLDAAQPEGNDPVEEALEILRETWRRNAEYHLSAAVRLPVDQIYVGDPQPFFDGLDELDEELRKRQFLLQTWEVLGGQDADALAGVSASLVPLFGSTARGGFDVVYVRNGIRVGNVEFRGLMAEPTELMLPMLHEVREILDIADWRFAQA